MSRRVFDREENERRLLEKAQQSSSGLQYSKEDIAGLKVADSPEFADARITTLAADGTLGNTAKSVKSYLTQLWSKLSAHIGLTTTAHGGIVPASRTVNGQALSGDVTITTITGNAGTATRLFTPRTINGVPFDGTANITVSAAASDVYAWAKAATKPTYTPAEVGAYSLGNTTNLQIKTNPAPNYNSAVEGHVEYRTTGSDYPLIGFNRPTLSSVSLYHKGYANDLLRIIDGGGNDYALIHDGNLGEKNIMSATKLQTARTINGVAFDGTADISLSAVAADVYPWAKAATKPAYTAAEVGALATGDVYAWAKAATKPTYTAAEVGAYSLGNSTNLQIKTNPAPNSNSAVEGHVEYRTTGADYPLIGFNRPTLSSVSLYHKGYANDLLRIIDGGGNDYALIHDGNLGEKNIMSATKLQTARTINGVAFDGTADISLSAVAVDVYPWAKAATKPNYTAAEVGALATGDVYAWAKAATKPTYTAAEVGAPSGSGNSTGTNTGDQTEILGNAGTATTLFGDQNSWATYRSSAVANMLGWKNYGNGHVIFDASNGTAPTGAAVNSTNSNAAWAASYPTLMGWNGVSTYGVRVDSARVADSAPASDVYSWAKAATKPSYTAAEVGAYSTGNVTNIHIKTNADPIVGASAYYSGHMELRSGGADVPIIGFHRPGISAASLYHAGYGNELLRVADAGNNDYALVHEGNMHLKNVGSATRLLTARTINGVSFDGTANITVSAAASDVYSWAKAATKPSYTASEVGASPTAGPGSGQAFSTGALTATSFKTGSVNVACTANTPATVLALTTGVWQVYATAFDAANYGASATIVVAQGTAKIVANNAPLGSFSMSGLNLQYTMGATTTATFTYIKII